MTVRILAGDGRAGAGGGPTAGSRQRPHIMIGAYSQTLQLMRQVGVSPKWLEARRSPCTTPGRMRLKAAKLPLALSAVGLRGPAASTGRTASPPRG